MSAAQSTIYVCSGVRLNSRYDHTIYFDSASAQLTYFRKKVVKTFSNYTFIRKSWNIKVTASMDEASSWSYLYFRNGTGKYYYYFIENVEYISDSTVELTLQMDVMQTYHFDYTLLSSFVEREHCASDQIGEHTIDEGLTLGEFTINNAQQLFELTSDFCILVLSTITLNGVSEETTVDALSMKYGKVFSGLMVSAIDLNDWAAWGNQLENLSTWGKIDGIVNMWLCPKALVQLGGESTWGDGALAKTVAGVRSGGYTAPTYGTTLDGYTPRNKKLFTYPYNFLYVTNNNGGDAVYRYERFSDGLQFNYYSALTPEAGVRLVPYRYNGVQRSSDEDTWDNNHEGLSLPGYPTCAWDSDIYKMWLAQNQNTHAMQMAVGVGSIMAGGLMAVATGGLGTLGGVGLMTSGASQVASLLTASKDQSIQPPQARGSYSGNVALNMDAHTFTFYNKSVTAENARIIDDYFTMYGYKVNRCKVPNRYARAAFTYTKTVGCHIQSNLCNADATKIEEIFDHGITFWRNGDFIGNYALNNPTL